MRVKLLCVFNDKVYEVPEEKYKSGKMFEAGSSILEMFLGYDTKNRAPYNLLCIWFNRTTYNPCKQDEVIYIYNGLMDELLSSDTLRQNLSNMLGIEVSAPIPRAKPKEVIPSLEELQSIKRFLNKKYPRLLENSPDILEYPTLKNQGFHQLLNQMKLQA
ncbi:hypothetical protein [Paenibacillus sp. GXUN7292]|uniref:hypothetical protein n=1 Tax=Paenibacillus sp. GXUN7292 TaxID=3422499 RepID=UPI003D7E8A4D